MKDWIKVSIIWVLIVLTIAILGYLAEKHLLKESKERQVSQEYDSIIVLIQAKEDSLTYYARLYGSLYDKLYTANPNKFNECRLQRTYKNLDSLAMLDGAFLRIHSEIPMYKQMLNLRVWNQR